ncbi:hypothetical protein L1049_027962 [Liquidambar formosana]|uniref:Uncharacterized protein n=1 Tax=Liquidambar formosana TaxID=63359 RepID=A0AAP0RI80_LIQFO
MGCGGSKLSPEGEVVPVGLRPLLWRRIDDLRRRRNASGLKGDALSKKELLEDAAEEDDNSSSPHDSIHVACRKSVSSPPEEEADSKVVLVVALPPLETEKKDKVHIDEDRSNKKPAAAEKEEHEKEIKKGEKEKHEKEVRKDAAMTGPTKEEVEVEVEEEGTDEEEEVVTFIQEEGFVCPGSPSFRVYYIDSLAANNKNDGKNDGIKGDESVESGASRTSDEGSVTKISKKGKKGMRFRRVIPNRRPAAVKNLLNVKSCYNPACSSHDNTRLLSPKAAA